VSTHFFNHTAAEWGQHSHYSCQSPSHEKRAARPLGAALSNPVSGQFYSPCLIIPWLFNVGDFIGIMARARSEVATKSGLVEQCKI